MTDPPPPRARFAPSPTGLLPRRQRADRAVQLAVRAPARGHVHPADRGHRRRERNRAGVDRRDHLGAATGSAWRPTRGRSSSRPPRRRTPRPSRRCGTAARSTPAAARREEIDERTQAAAAAGDPTPGYDGYCRDLGLPRGEGRALRFRTPDEGRGAVHDLVRGEVEFPQRAARGLHLREGERQAALRPGQRGGRPDHGDHARHPGRGPAADHARGRSCCGARSNAGRGP